MGSFLGPMLIGPVIAPLVGGALSDAFTWRATFVLLLVMSVPICLFSWIVVPETHHYFVSLKHPQFVVDKPVFRSPLKILSLLVDPELIRQYLVLAATFAAMFTSLTVLPTYLALEPYSLSPTIIGVCFLPVGVAMLIGALAGGELSDASARAYADHPTGRLVFSMGGVIICFLGCVGFGFSLGYQGNLAAVLLLQSVLGFGQAFYMPGALGYLSTVRQSAAASVSAVAMFVCFISTAICISVSVILSDIIGLALYFVILAFFCLTTGLWATVEIRHKLLSVTQAVTIPETERV
jgi:predicted MFS family arabinose efflux permease